jgi:hypothetical protein
VISQSPSLRTFLGIEIVTILEGVFERAYALAASRLISIMSPLWEGIVACKGLVGIGGLGEIRGKLGVLLESILGLVSCDMILVLLKKRELGSSPSYWTSRASSHGSWVLRMWMSDWVAASVVDPGRISSMHL